MISRILFADELMCISPEHCMEVCGSAAGCSNVAYPRLVMSVMPVGLRGLMMAVMIAALMSDLDSIFNSASTIFTLDIYKMLRQRASSRELVIVGKLFVVVMVAISIAWVPVIIEMQGGQMFYYIQEVSGYLTPPVAALFLLGVLWRGTNEMGAFWGGVVGFVLGLVRLILAFVYRKPHCDKPDTRPFFIKDVHFMYVAAILFWVSAFVTVVVSLCTPPPGKEQIEATTVWGLRKRIKEPHEQESEDDICTLQPLNQNGNRKLENGKCQRGSNKPTGVQACQAGNAHATGGRPGETQIGRHALISDPETAEEGDGKGRVDGEEDESCFGRGGVESGMGMTVLDWFCGVKGKAEPVPVQEQKTVGELLYEPPRTRVMLNAGLVLICSVGVFLFIFFSI